MNELINQKGKSMTTANDVTELRALFDDAEKSLRKLSRRGGSLVRQIIARGDANSLGALTQIELQALMSAVPYSALVDIVRLHQTVTQRAQELGIDVGPPPAGDDDITVNSSGR